MSLNTFEEHPHVQEALTKGRANSRSRTTVYIVEDHAIVRDGLRALLSLDPRFEVIGEADNGRDAVQRIAALRPALILMDLSMPGMNGMEAIPEIRRRHPEARIIVLTVHKMEEYIRVALEAGANGYVLKDSTHAELMVAIENVLNGESYLSPAVSGKVIAGYLHGTGAKARSAWDLLTHRERIVLKLIAEGRQNKSIAGYLGISVKTVEKHRANMMRKLDLHNVAAITAYAIENRLVAEAD